MKTTLEIPDPVFRKAKAEAAQRGSGMAERQLQGFLRPGYEWRAGGQRLSRGDAV